MMGAVSPSAAGQLPSAPQADLVEKRQRLSFRCTACSAIIPSNAASSSCSAAELCCNSVSSCDCNDEMKFVSKHLKQSGKTSTLSRPQSEALAAVAAVSDDKVT